MRRRLLLAVLLLLPACAADQPGDPPGPATGNGSNAERGVAPAGAGAGADQRSAATGEERLRAASGATTSAGTARTSFVATLTGMPGRPVPVSLTGSGAVDFATGRMSSNVDLSDAFELPMAERPTSRRLEPSWETISADGVVYLRAPVLSDLMGIETPWVRIDPSSELLSAADGFAPLARLAGNDSGAPLALLRGLQEGSVLDLGAEDVQGISTTHLRATVDLVAAVDANASPSDTEDRSLERFLAGLGARESTVDAFVDGDGRVRRIVYEHDLAPEAGGGTQRVELEYSDFGTPVVIEVPPEDQVSDLEQVFGGG